MEKQRKTLLPLTSDFVFKAVYGQDTQESNAALRALLNCLLDKKDNPIEWVQCANPFIPSKHITGKESILDIKVRLSSGQLVDLEMQVTNLAHYINRSIFYMGKLITSSLDKGQNYGKMKPTIVISIVNGTLFPNRPSAHSRYTLHEKIVKEELSDLTQIHFLELNKIDLAKPVNEMTTYERIGAYFKYANDESKQDLIGELIQYETEVLSLTNPILHEVSHDDYMRDLEEAHEKYLHDLATALEAADEARIEGENRISQLHEKLFNENRMDDLKRSFSDKDFRNQLLIEYGLK
ncbi:MAG: Rpn family recombination-promoting nuclease/putative transposase [Firmicutes bacterium]|nr:Rpn family recombination-promoting nuclease/putative transposase [Bacillota bacterium]